MCYGIRVYKIICIILLLYNNRSSAATEPHDINISLDRLEIWCMRCSYVQKYIIICSVLIRSPKYL